MAASVLLETDYGVLVLDVVNAGGGGRFLSLCQQDAFRNTLFYRVEAGFVACFGDPQGGGGEVEGAEYEEEEEGDGEEWSGFVLLMPRRRYHSSSSGCRMLLTLSEVGGDGGARYDHLRHTHVAVARVGEDTGIDALKEAQTPGSSIGVIARLNATLVDSSTAHAHSSAFRPLRDVRVRRSVILFGDPPVDAAAAAVIERDFTLDTCREEWDVIEDRPSVLETAGAAATTPALDRDALLESTNAIKLEILGDLANADARPEANALFVCKLNPITTSDNLAVIFGRFGRVLECEVKRDTATGQSLQYAFCHFAERESCEEAYRKMQNALIDGRRVKVDFSQSQGRRKGAHHQQHQSGVAAVAEDSSYSSSSSSDSDSDSEEDRKKSRKHHKSSSSSSDRKKHKKSKKHKKDAKKHKKSRKGEKTRDDDDDEESSRKRRRRE